MKKFILFFIFTFLIYTSFILASESVNINTGSLEELDEIIGIGPALGQRIIDARPFSSVDDLLRVKGIGEKTLQKIKDQGLACVGCESGSSLREAASPQTSGDEAISQTNDQIASSATPPRNDAPIIYPDGILINEILPSPEGADEENEWIELYNSNNFEVDLSGWKIQDSAGMQTTYIIKEKISAFGFLIFKRPETKITLNNEGDGLVLLAPVGAIKNSINFGKAPMGQSYNKSGTGWQWSSKPTPGIDNIIASASPSDRTKTNALPKTKKSDTNNIAEANLAGLVQANPVRNEISNGVSPWFLFFTTLAIAIISASVVLFIKIKYNANDTN